MTGLEQPEQAYLILTLERTGSGLLCDALERTGQLGTPYELFGADIHHRAMELGVAAADSPPGSPLPVLLPAYVDVIARQTMSGGVFGAKVHRNQYRELERSGSVTSPLDLVPGDCRSTARMVLLTRDDRERQAISVLLARGTGVWGQVEDDDAPEMVVAADPHWVARLNAPPERLCATLDEILETIVDEELGWSQWLATAGVDTLGITYEDLCEDYVGTVARVALHVAGVVLDPADVPRVRSVKQADERTENLLRLWR
jgi:LPS sulfotransferase NodH